MTWLRKSDDSSDFRSKIKLNLSQASLQENISNHGVETVSIEQQYQTFSYHKFSFYSLNFPILKNQHVNKILVRISILMKQI